MAGDDATEDLVDPRAPRFGQAITASVLIAAILLQAAVLVYAVASVLALAVVSRWRVDAYARLWRHGVRRWLPAPDTREPAAPHRFAKLLGATGTVVASLALALDLTVVGYGVALAVALLAGVAATTGLCVGCHLYRQVGFLRRHEVV